MHYLLTLTLFVVFVFSTTLQAATTIDRKSRPVVTQTKKLVPTRLRVRPRGPRRVPVVNWAKVNEEAKAATRTAIGYWCQTSKVKRGSINASLLSIPPNSLEGMNFSNLMKSLMIAKGIDRKIARAYAMALWQGWSQWSASYTISYPAFPSFAAFPGPMAPPTLAIPIPLATGRSSKALLNPNFLARQILLNHSALLNDPAAKKATRQYADWFMQRFNIWLASRQLKNIYGTGPVPGYVLPYTPVGPVVNGRIIPTAAVVQCSSF